MEKYKHYNELWDKSERYSKFIIGGLYAGFFILWSGTKDQVENVLMVSSALFMLFSISVYSIYEIFAFRKFQKLTSQGLDLDNPEHMKIYQINLNTFNKFRARYFWLGFWGPFVTGLIAVMILLLGFLKVLFNF